MAVSLPGNESDALVVFDPRTKLLIFIVAASVSLMPFSYATHVSLTLLICAMIFLNGKRGIALKLAVSFLAVLYLRFFVVSEPAPIAGVQATVMFLISVAIFFYPICTAFILLALTTRMSRLISSLQRMHLPIAAIIPLAVLVRFVPTVQDEWIGVRKAMAFRGISLSFGAILRHPMQSIEYILIPLLFSSLSVIEELASASLARGLDDERPRTSFDMSRLAPLDYLAMAISLVIFVAARSSLGVFA